MFAKLFLATLLASASGATLGAKPAAKALRLRGGLDDTTVLKINAGALALFGTEFGSALLGSKHGFLRYFGEGEPSVAIQQYSEAFGIGLLVLAAQTFDIATNGDDGAKAKFGKILTYGWIGWSLMHVKWYLEGTLRTTGSLFGQESFGQVGGGIPCVLTAARRANDQGERHSKLTRTEGSGTSPSSHAAAAHHPCQRHVWPRGWW